MEEPWTFSRYTSTGDRAAVEAIVSDAGLVVGRLLRFEDRDDSTPPVYAIVEAIQE